MPVRLTLANIFLKNGLERLVDNLYLSIFLGVIRRRMTMYKPQLRLYFFHNFVLKVTAMISENLTQDTELADNLIEYKEGNIIPIRFNCRNGLVPLIKLVDGHDNVLMPPNRSWVAIYEVQPPLGEGTNGNDWVKRG
jgi:hypothetical protein